MWSSLSNGKNACIGFVSVTMACIGSICIGGTCISGFGAIECLKMYGQSFQILRVKLFGT